MPGPFDPTVRRQHAHMVRDGDEVVIHFTNPNWRQGTLTVTCKDGVASIKYSDADGEFGSQIAKLTTD